MTTCIAQLMATVDGTQVMATVDGTQLMATVDSTVDGHMLMLHFTKHKENGGGGEGCWEGEGA